MSEQFDLFEQPPDPPRPTARATDPETSHKAPATVDQDEIQRMILDIASSVGRFTHHAMVIAVNRRRHLAAMTPLEPQTIRTRTNELVKQKLILDSGKKATVRVPGKKRVSKMIEWVITPTGLLRASQNAGTKLNRKLVA